MLLAKSLCVRDATKILSQLIVPMVFHFNLCNILRVLLTSSHHSQTKHYFVKTSPFENQTMAQCMCRVNQYTAPYIIVYTVCVL